MMKLRILLLLLFCSNFFIQAQEKNHIEVRGSAKMEIVPDEIYIAYVLEARDDDEESIDDIEKSLKSEFLQLGFSAPELKNTNAYTSSFLFSERQKEFREYRTMVSSVESLKQVFRILENHGALKAGIEKLSHSKLDDFKKELRVEAVEKAIKKAENMLMPFGLSRGKALEVKEVKAHGFYDQYVYSLPGEIAYESPTSDPYNVRGGLEFQKIELEIEVFIKFVIQEEDLIPKLESND